MDYFDTTRCEGFPACGHEVSDCEGGRYGSDDSVKDDMYRRMNGSDYDAYYDVQDY